MGTRKPEPKPSLEAVFTAFQNFSAHSLRAVNKSYSTLQASRELDRAREDLHEELKKLNIAQHIDWSVE